MMEKENKEDTKIGQPQVKELLRKAERLRQSLREELDLRLDMPKSQRKMQAPQLKPIIERSPAKVEPKTNGTKNSTVPKGSPKKAKEQKSRPVAGSIPTIPRAARPPNHKSISVQRDSKTVHSLPFPRKLLSQVYTKIQREEEENRREVIDHE